MTIRSISSILCKQVPKLLINNRSDELLSLFLVAFPEFLARGDKCIDRCLVRLVERQSGLTLSTEVVALLFLRLGGHEALDDELGGHGLDVDDQVCFHLGHEVDLVPVLDVVGCRRLDTRSKTQDPDVGLTKEMCRMHV